MTSNAQFSVYSSDDASSAQDNTPVKLEFAKLFGISEEKADTYFQSRKLIRKGLTQGQALAYQGKLEKIGMTTVVEETISQKPASNEPVLKQQKEPAVGGLSLLPADNDAAIPQSGVKQTASKQFSCPKCLTEQKKSDECVSCGVIFNKLVEPSRPVSSASATQGAKRHHQSEENSSSEGNLILTLVAAGATAIALAFVWKLITIQTGYEFGVVAWAIGGVMGGVGLLTGARGEVPAIACAFLAVCAILGGKYMIDDYYLAEADSFFGGELHEQIKAEYNEYWADIEAYQHVKKDDYSVKRFMSDYGYTNADSVIEISDEELAEFRSDMAYSLEEMDTVPDIDETLSLLQSEYEAELGTQSTFSYMIQNMGLMGAIFIFLGMGTAYRMVREAG